MNYFSTISSIYIEGKRNFKNTLIFFDPKINILVGPNGVGKTTILNLIKDFFSGNFYALVEEGKHTFVIVTLNEINLTGKVVNALHLKENLKLYKNPTPIKNVDLIKKAIFNISESKTYPPTQQEDFALAAEKDIIDKNGSLIIYFFKKRGTESYEYSVGGLLLIEGKLYKIDGLNKESLTEYFKSKEILHFNLDHRDDFYKKYITKLERKRELKNQFKEFKNKASKTLNDSFASDDQQIRYNSIPRMETEILNKDGKRINELSSGEEQLERLRVFKSACKEISPQTILIDEPELHLNYSQQTYLSDLIEQLKSNSQIFISSHSTYFIRAYDNKNLVYLRFSRKRIPEYVPLKNTKMKKNLIQHPDLFFAEKVIIVEALADSIFFQRSLDIILKSQNRPYLSSKNIYVLPSGGKKSIKNLVSFIKRLGINYIIIADLDFLLEKQDYSFLPKSSIRLISQLASKITKADKNKTIRTLKDISISDLGIFLEFLNRIFKNMRINKDDSEVYKKFIKRIETQIYDPSLISKVKLKAIHSLFRRGNVWLLKLTKLEFYVTDNLKANGKVSIDKINEQFYPENIAKLKTYLTNGSVDELKEIVKYISLKLY